MEAYWGAIGMIVGMTLGLTGAGGAIIAIPLFMHFQNMPLKEATIFSLLAVMIGGLVNWYGQRKLTSYKTSIIMFAFSMLGAWSGIFIKHHFSEIVIKITLFALILYALYSIFKAKTEQPDHNQSEKITRVIFVKILISGFILGLLTTLTGLGGGILLVPFLVGPLSFPLNKAIPTSLFTIFLSAGFSFIGQVMKFSINLNWLSILFLAIGIIFTALVLKFTTSRLKIQTLSYIRKGTFSLVALYALISLIIH